MFKQSNGQRFASYIIASSPPNILRLPSVASPSLKNLIHYLNEKTLLCYDLFTEKSPESENDNDRAGMFVSEVMMEFAY